MSQNSQNNTLEAPASTITAMANVDNRMKEHYKLVHLSELIGKGDPLDYKILNIINLVLKTPPDTDTPAQLERDDIEDLLLGLPTPEDILEPSFFTRAPLSFRLLSRALELHGISTVSDTSMSSVNLNDADKDDSRLLKQVWFLMLIKGSPADTLRALQEFRATRANSLASSAKFNTGDPPTHCI